jgi:crotonobetainyl-CoA:carnitine CoA-transferase CaiB-like acyl-CoA transferase/acetyl-CoA carboxylase beta subunit
MDEAGRGMPFAFRTEPSGPLAGIRVVDLSRVLAGPFATMHLADLGADVIKVERPTTGDDTRSWGPPFVGQPGHQESTYYLSVNRNKRSIALDLKEPADRELLVSLVAEADVLVENFRAGVMDRLGLSDSALEAINPRLVVASITAFGNSGPESGRPGYDQILQGEGGLMSLTGEPGSPTKVGVPIADISAGLFTAIAVLAALVERSKSGLGQRVSTSLLASQIGIHTFQATRYLIAGEVPQPSGSQHPAVAPYGTFWAADGPLVLAVGNDEIWQSFAPLVGLSPDDPLFGDNRSRVTNRAALKASVEAALTAGSVAAWLKLFSAHGVPAGEIKTLDRVFESLQVREQGLVIEVDHPTAGRLQLPGFPMRFSRSSHAVIKPPPLLDEHGAAIRNEHARIHKGSSWPVPKFLSELVEDFVRLPGQPVSEDPLRWDGYQELLEQARARSGERQAVVAGLGSFDGQECVVIAFEFGFLGGSMGHAEGAWMVAAAEEAIRRRLPLVSLVRSGGARIQEGLASLVQMRQVGAVLAAVRAAHIPHITVARDPTTGGVWSSLVAAADVIIAEAGAQIGLAGDRVRPAGGIAAAFTAEGKHATGFVDMVVAPDELRSAVGRVLRLLSPSTRGGTAVPPLPVQFDGPSPASGWAQVERARKIDRPEAQRYLDAYFSFRAELTGDRAGGTDDNLRIGFGKHGDSTVGYVAQLGRATTAAGYRQATRLLTLADRLQVPIVTLIDTPGAANDADAERSGVGTAIAELIAAIAAVRVPVLSVTVGEGVSGGAMALASDDLWMAAGSYFTVIAPEAAASILKQPADTAPDLADRLRVGPHEVVEMGIALGLLPRA